MCVQHGTLLHRFDSWSDVSVWRILQGTFLWGTFCLEYRIHILGDMLGKKGKNAACFFFFFLRRVKMENEEISICHLNPKPWDGWKISLILRNKGILNRFAKVDRWGLSLYLLIYFSEQEEWKIKYKPILHVTVTPGWLPSVRLSVHPETGDRLRGKAGLWVMVCLEN